MTSLDSLVASLSLSLTYRKKTIYYIFLNQVFAKLRYRLLLNTGNMVTKYNYLLYRCKISFLNMVTTKYRYFFVP